MDRRWQPDRDGSALPGCAVDVERPVVGLDDRIGDRKSESTAALMTATRGVSAVEAFGDSSGNVRRHALAVVDDRDDYGKDTPAPYVTPFLFHHNFQL